MCNFRHAANTFIPAFSHVSWGIPYSYGLSEGNWKRVLLVVLMKSLKRYLKVCTTWQCLIRLSVRSQAHAGKHPNRPHLPTKQTLFNLSEQRQHFQAVNSVDTSCVQHSGVLSRGCHSENRPHQRSTSCCILRNKFLMQSTHRNGVQSHWILMTTGAHYPAREFT